MTLTLKSENPNYAARVFLLPAPKPHPNANKLVLINVLGQTVITGLEAKEGDKYIYFPLECSINESYLSYTDSYSHAEKNRNKEKKGFFNDQGRVRAVRLRGTPSEGYIVPVKSLIEWLEFMEEPMTEDMFEVGKEFDTISDDIKLCEKYINVNKQKAADAEARRLRNLQGKVKRISKLVDNQFRFHIDTKQLKREIGNLNPDDTITISYKMHGASAIFAKILCKKKLSWYQRLGQKLGFNIVDSHYDYVYSSRRVVKNEYEEEAKKNLHYYDTDIWSLAASVVNPTLKNGITIYAELVGQTPTGRWIQKPYDYGTEPMKQEVYVYRITSTNSNGDVIEFTTPQVKRYCEKVGLKMVPVFYYGRAKDLFPELSVTEHWHDNLLEKLKQKYNEKECFMCKTKVPEEGVCLVIEKEYFEAYKLKSFKFLEHETSELDSGAVDVETEESTPDAQTIP